MNAPLPTIQSLLAQAPIEAVHLLRDGAADAASVSSHTPIVLWLGLGLALGIALLATLAMRHRRNRSPAEVPAVAFHQLSRRLRLSRADRSLVTSLAAASALNPHPVALLLSQDAFIRCAERLPPDAPAFPPGAIAQLHAKVFRVIEG